MPAGDHHRLLLLPLWRWWRCAAAAAAVLLGLALPAEGGIQHVTFDQNDMSDILPCVEALTPCQVEVRVGKVTPACCNPLSDLVAHNPQCICAMFFNTDLLDNFNLTQDRALEVAVQCHIPVSSNYCAKYINPQQADEMHRLLAPSPHASMPPHSGKNDRDASGCPQHGLSSALATTVITSSVIFFYLHVQAMTQ